MAKKYTAHNSAFSGIEHFKEEAIKYFKKIYGDLERFVVFDAFSAGDGTHTLIGYEEGDELPKAQDPNEPASAELLAAAAKAGQILTPEQDASNKQANKDARDHDRVAKQNAEAAKKAERDAERAAKKKADDEHKAAEKAKRDAEKAERDAAKKAPKTDAPVDAGKAGDADAAKS